MLSRAGYEALGIPAERTPNDRFFRAGLKHHNSVQQDPINDPDPSAWEANYREDIHAKVLLADDIRARLDQTVASIVGELRGLDVEIFVERGDKLRFDLARPEACWTSSISAIRTEFQTRA